MRYKKSLPKTEDATLKRDWKIGIHYMCSFSIEVEDTSSNITACLV